MQVKIGIATEGTPSIEKIHGSGITRVANVAIGLGFHWQRTLTCDFPGEISLNPDRKSPYTLINTLPLETYLECVVGSEMNPDAPIEFLRAHAIISRSWAAGKILGHHQAGDILRSHAINSPIKEHSDKLAASDNYSAGSHASIIGWEDTSNHIGFHLCSDDHCQRYQGLQPLAPEAREAIRSTAGIVLTTPTGEIVDARFSKCCGGITELFSTCWQDTEQECLEAIADPWCDLSHMPEDKKSRLLRSILKDYDRSTDGGFRWQTTVAAAEIRKRLKSRHNVDIGEITGLSPIVRGPSGRIRLLRINGTKGSIDIGKELYIRRLLSPACLYSSAFRIDSTASLSRTDSPTSFQTESTDKPMHPHAYPPIFTLKGRGWGHGVGLCQIGAAHMAAAGHDHTSILRFYYPGSELRKL